MAYCDLTQEELAEFFAHGGRIRKCPPRAVPGAGFIVERWRGSFYPVVQGPGELRLDGDGGCRRRRARG